MIDPAWSKKCAVILTNEVVPRAKKLGLTVSEFCDGAGLGQLARLEFDGIISRKTLREILDERVEVILRVRKDIDEKVKELKENDNIRTD